MVLRQGLPTFVLVENWSATIQVRARPIKSTAHIFGFACTIVGELLARDKNGMRMNVKDSSESGGVQEQERKLRGRRRPRGTPALGGLCKTS